MFLYITLLETWIEAYFTKLSDQDIELSSTPPLQDPARSLIPLAPPLLMYTAPALHRVAEPNGCIPLYTIVIVYQISIYHDISLYIYHYISLYYIINISVYPPKWQFQQILINDKPLTKWRDLPWPWCHQWRGVECRGPTSAPEERQCDELATDWFGNGSPRSQRLESPGSWMYDEYWWILMNYDELMMLQ